MKHESCAVLRYCKQVLLNSPLKLTFCAFPLPRLPLQALRHFNAYNARFRMPSTESGADHGTAMWYSFNLGPVHFVVVDTETDFPGASGDHFTWARVGRSEGFGDQLAWLEEVGSN